MPYTGMTPTQVLRYLNRVLGTLLQEIELSEDEMMRVVFQESLPTFSKYFPYKYITTLTDKDRIPGASNRFRLPKKDNLEIIGIDKVFGSSTGIYGATRFPLVTDPFNMQILNDAASRSMTPLTFEYVPPYEVQILPAIYTSDDILISIKTLHPHHLKTIPMNMRDEFLKLCFYDVLISLYPLRHRFTSLSTPYGEISPFLEQVDSAEENRNELLEKWRSRSLADSRARRIYIA